MTATTTDVFGAGERDEETAPSVEPCPFTVFGERIVVEMIEREETTTSGIVIVEDKKHARTEVVVVGFGRKAAEWFEREEGRVLEIGTRLIVAKHQRRRVEIDEDGRELHIVLPDAIDGAPN